MTRRCLFLFGAGASCYSVDCQPKPPPLGDYLFDEMVAEHLIPESFPKDRETLFRQKGGFELGMESLSIDSTIYLPFLRSMAILFAQYRPGENNLYLKLFRALNIRVEFTLATLNYENLIELALTRVGGHWTYAGTSGRRIVRVIKPHGSCGFLPDTGGVIFQDFQSGNRSFHLEAPIISTTNRERIQSWCNDPAKSSLAPAMSFYEPAKWTPISSRAVTQQRNDWATASATCDVCLVVGVRCNPKDAHVWKPLAESSCDLFFVNPCSDDIGDFEAWKTANQRKASVVPFGFEEALDEIIRHATAST